MLNDDMTKLRACVVEARIDLIIDDDTAADTCAERDHDGLCIALCSACDRLALCSSVCVVVNDHTRNTRILRKELRNREINERKIVGIYDYARIAVRRTGCCDTDICNILLCKRSLVDQAQAKVCHVARDLLCGTVCVCGGRCLTDDLVCIIDDTCGNVRTAKVNTDRIHSSFSF